MWKNGSADELVYLLLLKFPLRGGLGRELVSCFRLKRKGAAGEGRHAARVHLTCVQIVTMLRQVNDLLYGESWI